jgi:hypothetical protein
LRRIARDDLGLRIDPKNKRFLGQYVGRFRTENGRQDLSTGYHIPVEPSQRVLLNTEHYSQWKLVDEVPQPVGAMYRYYLDAYFDEHG